MLIKIACIAGTRPELIKMAPVIKAFQKYSDTDLIFVHSGQHYDENMSNIFIQELGLPEPTDNPSSSHKSSKIQNSDEQSTITINFPSTSDSFSISNAEKTEIAVSIVVPCLNEERTIGECIIKIKNVFRDEKLRGEIIVSDSSTDNPPTIAKKLGAAKKKLKIVEIPITYYPRQGIPSKLNPLKDGYRHLKLMVKLRFKIDFQNQSSQKLYTSNEISILSLLDRSYKNQ